MPGKMPGQLTISQILLGEIILATGYPLSQIAMEAKLSLITLNRIYTGSTKEPSLRVFKLLLGLYCRVCLLKAV